MDKGRDVSTASCIWQSIVLLCSCLMSTWSDFSWRSLQECFRMLYSLVRQLIHVWRQSMRLLEDFLALLVFDTKHTIYELCLPSERGFGMCMDLADPVLEREAQWDVRIHSSSCGAHCGVVHSPFGRLYHRCHCNYRDTVLFVDRLPWFCGPVLRGCMRRDVVWWLVFHS